MNDMIVQNYQSLEQKLRENENPVMSQDMT